MLALWFDAYRVSRHDAVPSPGEGLVRVVRLMLAHGRVVVTMRHEQQNGDGFSPRNPTQCPLRTGPMLF